jgi:hypothetical protein
VDRGFVLVAGRNGAPWCSVARAAAAGLGVALDAYTVGDGADLADHGDAFGAAYGTGTEGAVLLRPDDFIAWRATSSSDDPEGTIAEVLRQVLDRRQAPAPSGR